MRLILVKVILVLVCFVSRAYAQDDCAPLAPTNAQNLEESFKGEIEGKISGIVGKIAGGQGSLNGEYKSLITDTLSSYPDSHKLYVWQRIIYLICIRPDTKVDFNELLSDWLNGPPIESTFRYECDPERIRDTKAQAVVASSAEPTERFNGAKAERIISNFIELDISRIMGKIYLDDSNQIYRRGVGGKYRKISNLESSDLQDARSRYRKSKIFQSNLGVLLYTDADLTTRDRAISESFQNLPIQLAVIITPSVDLLLRFRAAGTAKDGRSFEVNARKIISSCIAT